MVALLVAVGSAEAAGVVGWGVTGTALVGVGVADGADAGAVAVAGTEGAGIEASGSAPGDGWTLVAIAGVTVGKSSA